jgi:osmotically-inducible protein OsmY
VTLKGKVENAQAKRDLADQIKAIPGVDQVDDQIAATNQ